MRYIWCYHNITLWLNQKEAVLQYGIWTCLIFDVRNPSNCIVCYNLISNQYRWRSHPHKDGHMLSTESPLFTLISYTEEYHRKHVQHNIFYIPVNWMPLRTYKLTLIHDPARFWVLINTKPWMLLSLYTSVWLTSASLLTGLSSETYVWHLAHLIYV